MPRPGPRPYECVKRAWHSDRHQPIRGSLIQEIFRIVNEIHSPGTKKNKEWQEKLPIVVLKAEEIMYSKANSEAEYVDVDTLRDRVNDAINTIIRRDESTESGELLQPCIEAALHLGCTPRRSSRSQRNITPRFYLNPVKTETTSVPPSTLENKLRGNYATHCPFLPQSSNLLATNEMNSSNTLMDSDSPAAQKNEYDYLKFPFPAKTVNPSPIHLCIPSRTHYSSSSRSVYPLYRGNQSQFEDLKLKTHCKSNSYLAEADRRSAMTKLTSCVPDASNVNSRADLQRTSEILNGSECDLSLRLGPLEVPCLSIESSWPQETQNRCLGASQVGSKSNGLSSQADKGFSFFSKTTAHDMLDASSAKRAYKSQSPNVKGTSRKRKIAVSHQSEGRQFCWPLMPPIKQINRGISNAGPQIDLDLK